MTPTNKLRFVERDISCVVGIVKIVRVLQQWWEPHYPGSAMAGEWRDVPLEEEE